MRAEIAARRPAVSCTVVSTVEEAVQEALALAASGDVILVIYEKIEPVLALLDVLGARPAIESAAGAVDELVV